MTEQSIADGVPVTVTDAYGVEHPAVARSGVEGCRAGRVKVHDFPVVWVAVARLDGNGIARVPWPATAVRVKQA